MPKLPIKKIIGERQERCLYCSGTKIIKKGKRRKKFETIQLWYCKDCDTVFGPRALKGKTYPIPVILDGLGYYYTGHSLQTSATFLRERYGIKVTPTGWDASGDVPFSVEKGEAGIAASSTGRRSAWPTEPACAPRRLSRSR